jgi:hypothetical protein
MPDGFGSGLNASISVEEVECALLRMKNGRMAGPDGMRGELLKGAYTEWELPDGTFKHLFALSHELRDILDQAFSTGDVPAVWNSAYLCSVFKRGDASVKDNYRGIAVGSTMGKLFSMILEKRLSAFCEQNGFRASGQAGFRPDRRTSDHVFVLKHLIDKSRLEKKHMFACFVDFRKAYDLVRRDLLMKCLSEIGVRDNMLRAIVSMYWSAPMITKFGRMAGEPFDSTRGVKQGDPLSPLLFGIFFDRVEQWLEERARECGVMLGGKLLKMLLYADDLALLASSPEELQQMLDALSAFCSHYDMEVNVSKTEVVVFGRQRYQGPAQFTFLGRDGVRSPVPRSSEFRYLGCVFHETKGVTACMSSLAVAGSRAMWTMRSRCADHGITGLGMQVHLFNSLVSPILSYCSEVWAPALLHSSGSGPSGVAKALSNDMQVVQFMFLRMLAGRVRKSTCKQLLVREFGCQPLISAWFTACWSLWDRVVSRPPGDWLFLAMQENRDLSMRALSRPADQRMQKSLWFWQFQSFTRTLHAHSGTLGDVPEALVGLHCLEQQDMSLVRAAFQAWLYQQWHDLPANPRTAGSESVVYSTYDRWFAGTPFGELDMAQPQSWCPDYVHNTAGLNKMHLASLMRFRLGAHDLRVATGRWERADGRALPRQQRLCTFCTADQVEDEFHMVFECDAYDSVREHFWYLFDEFGEWQSPRDTVRPDGRCLAAFMQQRQSSVAAFVHYCFLARRDPELVHVMLTGADSTASVEESELSELIEVSS